MQLHIRLLTISMVCRIVNNKILPNNTRVRGGCSTNVVEKKLSKHRLGSVIIGSVVRIAEMV